MAAKPMKAINSRSGKVLASHLDLADDFWRRLRGLLGKSSLSGDAGLLLKPCRCVHTFGMRCPIDLVFLGSASNVIAVSKEVPPDRLPPVYPGTCCVLELPAGKITETATRSGDLIVIEAQETDQAKLRPQRLMSNRWPVSRERSTPQREASEICEMNQLWEIAANILVATIFFLFAWSFAKAFVATPRVSIFLLVIKETLDAIFFLCRKLPKQVTSRWLSWSIAIGGTITPLLFRPSGTAEYLAANVLQTVCLCLQIAAMMSLNRSFGIVPANRGIKRSGMYRVVRHPLYSCYTVTLVGFVINNASINNMLLLLLTTIFQVARIFREEELLSLDADYRQYAEETKWKMIPFVF